MMREILVLIALVALFPSVFFSGCNSHGTTSVVDVYSLEENVVNVSYDDLARYPFQHKGKAVIYRGKIVQKVNDILRVDITEDEYGRWTDTVYVELKPSARNVSVLEGDIIQFTGIANGTMTYESVLRVPITIPWINAYKLVLLEKR